MLPAAGSSTDGLDAPRVVVTGASGFVGLHAVRRFLELGWRVTGCVRKTDAVAHDSGERVWDAASSGVDVVAVGDVGPDTSWDHVLPGAAAVVHCAALAHVHENEAVARFAEFQRVNVEGTRALAIAAARAGVRRLVLVSSIGVNGSRTAGAPFRESDEPRPQGVYARSKWQSEAALREVGERTRLDWVVIRPALVFGPGAPGNVERLLGLVARGLWLPFGSIENRRSMVGIDALCDLLAIAATHPMASQRIFLAAEDPPLSTPALVRALARGLERRPRLVAFPVALLRIAGRLLRRSGEVGRLCDSLEIDATTTRDTLGWESSRSIEERVAETARAVRVATAP